MTFDVIVTTYNRPERVEKLVRQFLSCSLIPDNIIVVDSSEKPHLSIRNLSGVVYVRSSHKNQPYQRYLGAMTSKADILCFFDDDLEVTNKDLFELLIQPYEDENVAGSSIAIDYHNSVNAQGAQSLMESNNSLGKIFLMLSGVKFPAKGKISYAGMTGSPAVIKQEVDFFYGPCMSFRRLLFNQSFNIQLLDMFEQKLGMGEDKIISMEVSKYGKLIYNPIICLFHPAVESTYFNNIKDFTAKTLYSRLLINTVFTRTKKKNSFIAKLHLAWYVIGRLVISAITYLIKQEDKRQQKLKGLLKGIKLMIQPTKSPGYNWLLEIETDLKTTN
jgi:glycosyltransferase involved in cell wall biosynthesis